MSLSDLSWGLYRLSIFVATLTEIKGTSQLSRERRSSKERNLIKRKESRSKRREHQEEFFTKTRRVLYNEASELISLQAQELGYTFPVTQLR
ncbi:hypothetical protein LguiB_001629 [Lonicera macranthoides]